ncbi:MAG: helix-turn-helix transcriptional regulator [Victivallaceae bacterium]|nr:helix-turn-helix transcriptional regulator [Victivallaceae bacterium]
MEKIKSFKHFYRNPVKLKNFVINGIGVCEAMQPGIVNRPGGTGDSLLMFFHDEAIVNIKDELLTVAAGSLIYWDKCGHYYGNADIPWRHSWIHFDGSKACEILRLAGLHPYQVTSPPVQIVEQLLTELDNEISVISPDILMIRDIFEIFVRKIVRTGVEDKNKIQIPERMIAIKEYIENNYHKALPLAKTARRFSISSPHLSAEFKRWFGISPGKCQIECRLHEAEILLKDKNLQIADIAERVGWDDVYHFSKIFKRHRGVQPSSMRSKS